MNPRLFLSGSIAIIVEIGIFLLLFFALIPKAQKQYTLQEKTVLEFIQIEEIKKQEKPKQTQKTKSSPPTKQNLKKTEQKPSPFPSPKVGSDVRKLFEKIDSSNPPIREEKIEDNRPTFSANTMKKQEYTFNQDNSQIKEQSSKIQNALESLWENELEVTSPKMQDISDGEYNEWFAKIKEILYAKWTNSFYESVAMTVNIVIEANGSFNYRIIRYSKNNSYNLYMEELLESLSNETFPPYPKGRIRLEVIFKTKENNHE